jgi:hypothetical protein
VYLPEGVTTSWDGDVQPNSAVTFRATASGELSQMLGVSSRITKAEAYNAGAERLQVALPLQRRQRSDDLGLRLRVVPEHTEPVCEQDTQIGFHLPEATKLR